MSKKLVLLILLLLSPLAARATSVTATVVDADSQSWNNGTWSATLVTKPGFFPPQNGYLIAGSTTQVPNQNGLSGALDASGAFSTTLTANGLIAPAGTAWRIQVCPQASGPCFVASVDIVGTTQDISASLAPPVIVVNMQVPAIGYLAYSDSEVTNGGLGQTYWNLTSQQLKICSTLPCGWVNLSGSGTVTSLTATSPVVATPSPITGVGVLSCPTCNTSSATIAGSIASPQVAFGSSANTVNGSNNFEWDPASGGVVITTSNVGPANVTGAGLAMSNSGGGTTTAYLVKGTDNSLSLRNDSALIPAKGLLRWDTNGVALFQGGSNAPQLTLYTGASISPFGDGSAVLDIFSTGATPHVFAVHADPGAGDAGNIAFNPFTSCMTIYGDTSGNAAICTALAAGTPNPINLPLATGSANGLLATDGANPQQTSWTLTPSLTTVTLSSSLKTTNLLISHTAPTVSSGFGTGASVTTNNGTAAFLINVGTTNTGTGVLSLPAASTGWACNATDTTTTSATVLLTKVAPTSTTSVTFQNYDDTGATHAWVDSDILEVNCFGY